MVLINSVMLGIQIVPKDPLFLVTILQRVQLLTSRVPAFPKEMPSAPYSLALQKPLTAVDAGVS